MCIRDSPQIGHTDTLFGSCDLDLDSTASVFKPDLVNLKVYLHIKMNFQLKVFKS